MNNKHAAIVAILVIAALSTGCSSSQPSRNSVAPPSGSRPSATQTTSSRTTITGQPNARQNVSSNKTLATLRAKAEKGDAESQCELGAAFLMGKLGAAQNVAQGVEWIRKSAEQDCSEAQYTLGLCYLLGLGVAKDMAEFNKWIRLSMRQGNTAAIRIFLKQREMVTVMQAMEGSQREVDWLEQNKKSPAEKGKQFSPHAQQSPADGELSAEIRTKAENGDALFQSALGEIFLYGVLGVAKDEAEAVKWFRKAAEQNHAEAQCSLGSCYFTGQGVAKDTVESWKWISLSAGQGNNTAIRIYLKRNEMMTSTQVVEGFQRAADWLEQYKKASAGKSPQP